MIRFLIIVALGYGIYWSYYNVDFNALKESSINFIKQEKTINAVIKGRQESSNSVNEALNN